MKKIQGVDLIFKGHKTQFDGSGNWVGILDIKGKKTEKKGNSLDDVASPLFDILYSTYIMFETLSSM